MLAQGLLEQRKACLGRRRLGRERVALNREFRRVDREEGSRVLCSPRGGERIDGKPRIQNSALRAAFLMQRASSANRAHSCRERFTALRRDAAADDGGLGAVRCRLKTSSLIPWLGTAKSSGTHARALTPACSMPASGSALFLILLQSYGVSAGNSAPLPVSAW